jgi:predicted nucleotidyltransferase component of viral defense system
MPDIGRVLQALAREKSVRLEILEKDYALSYLLVALAETPGLGDQIGLKGGTALRKLYYPSYRFSEDLDYSTVRLGPLAEGAHLIEIAINHMEELLQERGPFTIQFEPLTLRLPHPGQQMAYLVRIQFPYHRHPLCRLKIEITIDEPILLPLVLKPVLHEFPEKLAKMVRVYTLEEIVAEKLRALLQVRGKLVERGWGASRVCRDYYDLWYVLQQEGSMNGKIPDLLMHKCAIRHVVFHAPQDFLTPDLLNVARSEWQSLLLPFVLDAPPAERVITELQSIIPALWD